jgi:hypothetical protein
LSISGCKTSNRYKNSNGASVLTSLCCLGFAIILIYEKHFNIYAEMLEEHIKYNLCAKAIEELEEGADVNYWSHMAYLRLKIKYVLKTN